MRFKAKLMGKAVLFLAAVAVLGWAVMMLWNAVVPAAFSGARALDYLHALGLLVLSRILFGGFRGHHGGHGRRRWEKWKAMTSEERHAFRHAMHARHAGDRE